MHTFIIIEPPLLGEYTVYTVITSPDIYIAENINYSMDKDHIKQWKYKL